MQLSNSQEERVRNFVWEGKSEKKIHEMTVER